MHGRRFFDEHMRARIQTVLGQAKVRRRRGRNVHDVGASFAQHPPVVGEPPIGAVSVRRELGHGARKIADADQTYLREACKAGQMLLRNFSGADYRSSDHYTTLFCANLARGQ